jgi:DNA ligase (NAD+)
MAVKKERIDSLVRLIKKHQDSYYNGEAEISDAEFDLLWDELKNLDPKNPILKKVGADGIDGFPKARHLIPMGSQEKAANPDAFREWAAKIAPASYVVQYKLDGASLELQYEKGKLKAALTRGDGVTGDEITRNALRIGGVLPDLGLDFSGGVRGEVIMTHEVWKARHKDKANCRNAANGIMRRKDGEGCGDLRFISYDASAIGDDGFFTDEIKKIEWLKKRGFRVTETREFTDSEEVVSYREAVAEKRKSLPFDIDGLVVKDRATDMTDLRRARPERQIAFKFELETAFSILRAVEWSESGATYTPIGIVDPVRLAGTTVQRANLNNPDMIRAMGLKIGSAVSVVKRGEIIPKIEGLAPEGSLSGPGVDAEIEFPQTCSSCGTSLVDGGTRLYCPNSVCPKRLYHRLEKWVSILDIMELGDKLLRQLFDRGRVSHIADLYTLEAEELAGFDRMGDLSAAKVVRHIMTKREISLAAFVAGFDLEGVGELVMEKAVSAGFDTLEKLRSAQAEELSGVYGLGLVTAQTITEGLKECAGEMDEVLAAGVISVAPPPEAGAVPLKGVSFCFTGELETMRRNQAEEKIKALGGSAKPTVVKDLTYLVTNDPRSGSAKNKKALNLGVEIIDEEQFLALLKDPAKRAPAGNAALKGKTGQGELF